MEVPGEDLPKVTHYYREPFPYVRQNVAVIGAKNSAAKAALDCYRHGATSRSSFGARRCPTSSNTGSSPTSKTGSRKAASARTSTRPSTKSAVDAVAVQTPDGPPTFDNDWVLAMTGYHPDYGFLEALASRSPTIRLRTPIYDETTFETAARGIYLAGTVCGGYQTGPLVHRERPLSREADRRTRRQGTRRTGGVSGRALENGRVRPVPIPEKANGRAPKGAPVCVSLNVSIRTDVIPCRP